MQLRSVGRPNLTSSHSFLNDILKIIPNVIIYGSLYTWDHINFHEVRWTHLVNSLRKGELLQPSNHAPE